MVLSLELRLEHLELRVPFLQPRGKIAQLDVAVGAEEFLELREPIPAGAELKPSVRLRLCDRLAVECAAIGRVGADLVAECEEQVLGRSARCTPISPRVHFRSAGFRRT